jgi:NADPH:quinone reductase-like Zn-dependent oxidoreductase
MDLAGNVEAVGSTVTRFQPGDEVFGWTDGGSYAEYACAPEDHFRPETIEPLRCAGGGRAHLRLRRPQALRDVGQVQAGQEVLVIGAGRVGWGSFAVQLAKAFGAQVTKVCSPAQVELVRSIGADDVVDYTREDVTDGSRH